MARNAQSSGFDKAKGPALTPEGVLGFLLHLPKFAKLYWRLLRDPRVSWLLKTMLVAACLYVASPLDLIPDWAIPVLGYADDLAIFLLAARTFIRKAPREVVLEHLERIEREG